MGYGSALCTYVTQIRDPQRQCRGACQLASRGAGLWARALGPRARGHGKRSRTAAGRGTGYTTDLSARRTPGECWNTVYQNARRLGFSPTSITVRLTETRL